MTLIIIVLIAVWIYSKYSSKNERKNRNTYSTKNSTKSVRNAGNSYSTKKSSQILKEEQEEKEDLYKKGEECLYGINGIQKLEAAYGNFLSAAEQGNSSAEYMVGVLLETGAGVQKNPQEALLWYKRAANNANTKAQYKLGKKYIYGEDIEKDIELGKKLIWKAAQNGNKSAQDFYENLGAHIESSSVRSKSQETIPKVNKPNDQAYQLYRKGWDYEQGNGVEVDIALAMDYYHKAADLGSEIASNRLKTLNEQGYSDLYKRKYGYQKSVNAKSTDRISTVNKPIEKMNDNQPANDDQQAHHLFRKGWDYEQGNGVKADIALAMDYYHKAADLGSEIASYRLKMLNERGYSDLYKRSISDQQRKESKVNNDSNTSKPEIIHKTNDDVAQRGVSVRERAQKSQQLFNRATEQKRQGQYQLALKTYKQAYEVFPEDQDLQSTMYAMAKVYLLIGDYEKACALFQDGLTQKLFKDDERVARFYNKYLMEKYRGTISESDPEYVWFKKMTADYSIFIGLTHYLLENNGAELLDQYRYDFINHIKSVAGKPAEPPSREYLVTCYEYGWTRVLAIASESFNRCFDKIDLGYVQKRKQEFLDILKTI